MVAGALIMTTGIISGSYGGGRNYNLWASDQRYPYSNTVGTFDWLKGMITNVGDEIGAWSFSGRTALDNASKFQLGSLPGLTSLGIGGGLMGAALGIGALYAIGKAAKVI
jgi:hypothetical protein